MKQGGFEMQKALIPGKEVGRDCDLKWVGQSWKLQYTICFSSPSLVLSYHFHRFAPFVLLFP